MTQRSFALLIPVLAGLLTAPIASRAEITDATLAKSTVLDGNLAYLQVGQVGTKLADEIRTAQGLLSASNQITGTILDLRFAGGTDFDSAKLAADLFASRKTPLAILVNGETSGEAVVLAALLHQARGGLIFGDATQPIKFTGGPLQPDIAVKTGLADERTFRLNPYLAPEPVETNAPATTNALLPFVDHMSEAELVSKRAKDGEFDEPDMPRAAPAQPVIRDPALARAVDWLKALAVLHKSRG
jgi:hypothetical protein